MPFKNASSAAMKGYNDESAIEAGDID